MEDFFSEVRASGSLKMKVGSEKSPTELLMSFVRSGGSSKFSSRQIQPEFSERVWCRNPEKYVFQINRMSENSSFTASNVLATSTPLSQSKDIFPYRFLDASFSISGIPLSKIMQDPSFSIKTISNSKSTPDGRRLISMKYDFARTGETQGLVLRSGEVWLSPERGWAIEKYRTATEVLGSRVKDPVGEIDGAVEYERMEQGVAIPKRVIAKHTLAGRSNTEEFIFEDVQHIGSDKKDFTLSYYGLPEADPDGFTQGRSMAPLWLIATNVGLFLGVIILGWLRWRLRVRS